MEAKYKRSEDEYRKIAHEVLEVLFQHDMGREEAVHLLENVCLQVQIDIPLRSIRKHIEEDLDGVDSVPAE